MEQRRCERCKIREATVHILELLEVPEPMQRHLCETCFNMQPGTTAPPPSIPDLFLQIMAHKSARSGTQKCPECGLTLREFRAKGRFGCAKDYEVFASQLDDLMEKIHGETRHTGRAPGEAGIEQAMREVDQLKDRLRRSIAAEDYEQAARLRDRIDDLISRIQVEDVAGPEDPVG
ncbi:MAG: UvrB/UvrC motif-containing protein [Planctomycetes bacterium]|nr:UvrB/UvrC motif-containing protein [Planctomycetota bacterium]